MTNDLPTTDWL